MKPTVREVKASVQHHGLALVPHDGRDDGYGLPVNPSVEFNFDDHNCDDGRSPVVKGYVAKDEDGRPPREQHYGCDAYYGPAITSHRNRNHHHGLAMKPNDVQIQTHSSHHGRDGHREVKSVVFKGVSQHPS